MWLAGLKTQLQELKPRVEALLASISDLVLQRKYASLLTRILSCRGTKAAVSKAKKDLLEIVLILAEVTAMVSLAVHSGHASLNEDTNYSLTQG